jgi:chromate transporter
MTPMDLTRQGAGAAAALPSLAAALRVWARIGLLSFGGPAGQIAMLHREIVQTRHWLSERRFLHALSFCALLPGPEAMQLATYLGWAMHGPVGGVCAGTLFVLPGAAVLLGLSVLYVTLGHVPAVDGLFEGLRCAVLAIVVQALVRIGARALRTRSAWTLAAASFVALYAFAVPFPAVVLTAGLIGAARPRWFDRAMPAAGQAATPGLLERALLADPGRLARQAGAARRAGLAALALWLAPVAALRLFAPGRFADIAWFFTKMAVVTVGGAYAVLAYVAQDAVHRYHWLAPPEMLAGLGLAETTPGPLVLVVQFVGFLAGTRAPGGLHGLAGGMVATALTLWVTFMPCFGFVFLGAPVVERWAENMRLAGGLAAVTASVVGVIANLAVWFSVHVLFAVTVTLRAGPAALDLPVPGSVQPWAAMLAGLAAVLLFMLRENVARTLAACALLGLAAKIV